MFKMSVISTNATYQLNRSVNPINEGAQVAISLTTTGVQNGQSIPYTISGTGITAGDFVGMQSLTGSFTVLNNTASLYMTASNDLVTEGAEAFRVSLENGTYVDVDVNDTSLTPGPTSLIYMPLSSDLLDANGHTVTATGGISITSIGGFNCVQFGAGKALAVPISPEVGNKNFTLTVYMYRVGPGSSSGDRLFLVGNYAGGGFIGLQDNQGAEKALVGAHNVWNSTLINYPVVVNNFDSQFNKWVKLTLKRIGGTAYVYVDDVSIGSYTFDSANTFTYGTHGNVGGLMLGAFDNASAGFSSTYYSTASLYMREVMFAYD